jgi:hypothetical protein
MYLRFTVRAGVRSGLDATVHEAVENLAVAGDRGSFQSAFCVHQAGEIDIIREK